MLKDSRVGQSHRFKLARHASALFVPQRREARVGEDKLKVPDSVAKGVEDRDNALDVA